MKKNNMRILLACLLMIFMLVSCSKTSTPASTPSESSIESPASTTVETKEEAKPQSAENHYPISIENFDKSTLTLEKEPKRIVSLILGTDELLLGFVDPSRIAGLSGQKGNVKAVSLAAKEADQFPKVENNFEEILKLQPDLIIGSAWAKKELKKQIADAGIPYYGYKSPNTIEEQKKVIRDFAKVLGNPKKGEEIVADMEKRIDAIKEKVKDLKEEDKISILPYNMHGTTNAKGTIVDEAIYLCGAKNAATEAGLEKRAKISKEKIIELDPDAIILYAWGMDDLSEFNDFVDQLKKDPSLQELKAIKNNRIYVEDGRYMMIVTQHLIHGIEFIAESAYPDLFK